MTTTATIEIYVVITMIMTMAMRSRVMVVMLVMMGLGLPSRLKGGLPTTSYRGIVTIRYNLFDDEGMIMGVVI